jgi:hypothetical protein
MANASTVTEASPTGAQIACEIGWVMALLNSIDPDLQSDDTQDTHKLPSTHELGGALRLDVERGRLEALVARLGGTGGPCAGSFSLDLTALNSWSPPASASAQGRGLTGENHVTAGDDAQQGENQERAEPISAPPTTSSLQSVVRNLNTSILEQLARCGLTVEAGYRIGRSLYDTVNPPMVDSEKTVIGIDSGEPPELQQKLKPVLAAFEVERISTIQRWLTTTAGSFSGNTAQLVSVSLGRWAVFVDATLSKAVSGDVKNSEARFTNAPFLSKGELCDDVRHYLVRQGDIWLNLLAGSQSTSGLITPEGYVEAAEAALRRTGRIVRGVLRHYWAVAVLLALTIALILSLTFATDWLGGPGKVWTTIATAAAALGISWKGIASAVPKLAEKGENPVFALEELDAMAWALTTLPPAQINATAIRRLRSAGVPKTAAIGRT